MDFRKRLFAKQLVVVAWLAVMLLFVFGTSLVEAVVPFGASVVPQGSGQTAPADPAGSHAAIAGNVSEVDISGFTTTQSWQGYYGNISGTIQLADGNTNVLYNWNLTDASGEVLASTNDSLIWTNIQCFNFTALGTFADDSGNRGNTSQFGTNLSQLESNFNINSDDVDGVNETFNLTIGGDGHDRFFINNLEFSDSECQSTKLYSDSGGPIANQFEEVLLYEPDTRSVVFTALAEPTGVSGFDSASHDFEMIVLEDGHGTDTSTTTYYFYVELE